EPCISASLRHAPARCTLFPYTTLFRSEKFSKLNFNKFLEELDGRPVETESKEFSYKTSNDLKGLIESSKKTKEIFFKSIYDGNRSEEHTSELQSRFELVCRLLLEKKNR